MVCTLLVYFKYIHISILKTYFNTKNCSWFNSSLHECHYIMFHLGIFFFHSTLFYITIYVTKYRSSLLLLTAVYYSITWLYHTLSITPSVFSLFSIYIYISYGCFFFRMNIQKWNCRVFSSFKKCIPASKIIDNILYFLPRTSVCLSVPVFKSFGILFLYTLEGCM